MVHTRSFVRTVSFFVCASGLGIGIAKAEPPAPRAVMAQSAPAASLRAPKPPAAPSTAAAPAVPNGPSAAATPAGGGSKSRVITISEVTIVGRIQKPIASVDVSRIQPKLTLAELRQPFLQRIEDAVYRAPF